MKKIIGLLSALAMMSNGICVSADDETEEKYFVMEDEVILQEYCNKEASEITIPDYVEIIGEGAFKDCTNLKTIIIPSTVKCIRENAFMNCKSLESVEMTNSVEVIGDSAFAYCPNLKSFVSSVNAFKDAYGQSLDYDVDIFGHSDKEYPSDILQPTTDVNISFAPYDDENTYYITVDEIISYPHETYPISIRSDSICSITLPEYVLSLGNTSVYCPNLKEINAESVIYAKENFIVPTSNETTILISDAFVSDNVINPVYAYSIALGFNVNILSDNITTKLGDINYDGNIDVRDVTSLKKYVVKLTNLDEIQFVNADIIGDNTVDVKDLGQLLKYIIKVITTLRS